MTPSSHPLLAEAERLRRQSSRPPPPPLNPGAAAEAYEQARDLAARGRYDEAMARLRVASRSPRFAGPALQLVARLQRRLNRNGMAIATLKDALHQVTDDDARSAAIYEELADLSAQLDQLEEAAYYMRRAVRLAPERPELAARLQQYRERAATFAPPTRPQPRPR